ncbi:MAG TPA: nuclear transport factor 2 family protein [Chitinophagaceae bacterium]|jgi:ketosteroid isomerase-like protein|nr:nuclear transport factor 2 family protein [Chitinophagaceae bacterium]
MPTNEELISRFYSAFQRLDYQTMNDCYSDDIIFSDPVFYLLRGNQAKCMWEMLCKNAKDFSLEYGNITAIDHEYYTCEWTATYTFSKTGRTVVNKIKAFMKINEGKIIEHSDAFRLSTWIAQAFGWKGVLFGWMGWMKRKVQKAARKNLVAFMEKKGILVNS